MEAVRTHLEGVQEGSVNLQEADDRSGGLGQWKEVSQSSFLPSLLTHLLTYLGQRGLQLLEGVHDVAESQRLHLLEHEQRLDRGGHLVRGKGRVAGLGLE